MSEEMEPNTKKERKVREPVVYELEYPFDYDDEEIESVTLKRLSGGDIMKFNHKGGNEEFIKVISRTSGISRNIFARMDASDFAAVVDIVSGFLSSGREI